MFDHETQRNKLRQSELNAISETQSEIFQTHIAIASHTTTRNLKMEHYILVHVLQLHVYMSPVVRKNRAAASTIKPRYRQKYFYITCSMETKKFKLHFITFLVAIRPKYAFDF